MYVSELKVGMIINLGCASAYDYVQYGRVEASAFDWAVVREEANNRVWLLESPDTFELCDPEDEDEKN